jgi:hypothetical protein
MVSSFSHTKFEGNPSLGAAIKRTYGGFSSTVTTLEL